MRILRALFKCFSPKNIGIDVVCCPKVLVVILNKTSWLGVFQTPKEVNIQSPYKNKSRTLVIDSQHRVHFHSKVKEWQRQNTWLSLFSGEQDFCLLFFFFLSLYRNSHLKVQPLLNDLSSNFAFCTDPEFWLLYPHSSYDPKF